MKRTIAATGVVVLVAVSIAACGSSSSATKTIVEKGASTSATHVHTSSTDAAMTKAQAAKTYLADVKAANAADTTFGARAGNSTSAKQLGKLGAPLAQVFQATDSKLLALAQAYPPASADLKAQVNADAAVIADLQTLGTINALNESSAVQQFTTDGDKLDASSDIVRSDLGLPQTKG